MTDMTPNDRELATMREAWSCKIGSLKGVHVPPGGDAPMRSAIEDAFFRLTGEHAEATFSGWGDKFSENERAVIENRLPILQTDQIATLTAQADAARAEAQRLREALLEIEKLETGYIPTTGENDQMIITPSGKIARAALAAREGNQP